MLAHLCNVAHFEYQFLCVRGLSLSLSLVLSRSLSRSLAPRFALSHPLALRCLRRLPPHSTPTGSHRASRPRPRSFNFFGAESASSVFNEVFARTLADRLESLETFLLGHYDAISILIMIRIVARQRAKLREKDNFKGLDSFLGRQRALLWTRLDAITSLNLVSMRRARIKKLGRVDTGAHYVSKRLGKLVSSYARVALSCAEASDSAAGASPPAAAAATIDAGGALAPVAEERALSDAGAAEASTADDEASSAATSAATAVAATQGSKERRADSKRIISAVDDMLAVAKQLLDKLAAQHPSQKEQAVFLINNYDMLCGLFEEMNIHSAPCFERQCVVRHFSFSLSCDAVRRRRRNRRHATHPRRRQCSRRRPAHRAPLELFPHRPLSLARSLARRYRQLKQLHEEQIDIFVECELRTSYCKVRSSFLLFLFCSMLSFAHSILVCPSLRPSLVVFVRTANVVLEADRLRQIPRRGGGRGGGGGGDGRGERYGATRARRPARRVARRALCRALESGFGKVRQRRAHVLLELPQRYGRPQEGPHAALTLLCVCVAFFFFSRPRAHRSAPPPPPPPLPPLSRAQQTRGSRS